jgi:hypothetical protein
MPSLSESALEIIGLELNVLFGKEIVAVSIDIMSAKTTSFENSLLMFNPMNRYE